MSADIIVPLVNFSWDVQTPSKYTATLRGDEVVPQPVNTNASGTVDFTFTEHVTYVGKEEHRHPVRCRKKTRPTRLCDCCSGIAHATWPRIQSILNEPIAGGLLLMQVWLRAMHFHNM